MDFFEKSPIFIYKISFIKMFRQKYTYSNQPLMAKDEHKSFPSLEIGYAENCNKGFLFV